MAAELTEILSAPADKITSASSILEIPPPTVNGIFISLAIRVTSLLSVLRFSCDAVISRNTSSSAPLSL